MLQSSLGLRWRRQGQHLEIGIKMKDDASATYWFCGVSAEQLCVRRLKAKRKETLKGVEARYFTKDTLCNPVDKVEDCEVGGRL